MKVNEVIKMTNNFIVVKNGKILALNNEGEENGIICDSILNSEVEKTYIIKGLYADYTRITL